MHCSLVLGAPGAAVGDAVLRREVAPLLGTPHAGEFWFVARSAERRRAAQRALAEIAPGALPLHFFTVPELLGRLGARLDDAMPVLGHAERRVLLRTCLGAERRPGLVLAMAELLGELAAAGARDPALLPAGLARDALSRYEARRALLGLRDPDELGVLVTAALAAGRLSVPRCVIVDGLTLPSRAEIGLLRALAPHASRLVLVAELAGAPEALAAVDEVYRPLLELASELGARVEPIGPETLSPRRRAARALFGPPGGPASAGAALEVLAFPDRRAEVDGMATAIRRALGDHAPPEEIVVGFAGLDEYAALVRERFARFQIPFEIARGLALGQTPLVRAAFALGEAALAGLERRAVERALGCPLVRARGLDFLRIDRQARAAGVTGGGGGRALAREWLEPLAVWARAEPGPGAAPVPPVSPLSEEERRRLARRRDAPYLLGRLPALGEALEALAALEAPRPPLALARALGAVWSRFGLDRPDRPADAAGAAATDLDPELARQDAAAWARLMALCNETARGLQLVGAREVGLGELLEALRAAVLGETLRPAPPTRGPAVRVMALADLGGLSCGWLFLGGLTEARLPGPPPASPLLGEADRRRLGLFTAAQSERELRHLFGHAIAAPGRGLWLSLPCEGLLPEDAASGFLQELGRHVAIAFREPAPGFAPAEAFSEDRRQRLLASVDAPALAEVCQAGAGAIAAARRAEAARDDALSAWDGLLDTDGVSDGLRRAVRQDLGARLFANGASATQLDRYAGCPFRFFGERVLDLSPLEDPLEPDHTLNGQIVHAVLHAFYRGLPALGAVGERLRQGPAAFGPGTDARAAERAWVDAARGPLGQAARQTLALLSPPRPDAFFTELGRRLLTGLEEPSEEPGLLLGFLLAEARTAWDHEPFAFELVFGRPAHRRGGVSDRPELAIALPGGAPLRLSGAIDRVDRLRGRADRLVVLDYKTGRAGVPRRAQIALGYRFQLPIYLASLRGPAEPHAGGYYHLAHPAEVRRQLLIGEDALDPERLLERLPDAVRHLVGAARGGHFHPGHLPAREKGCSFCEQRMACRVGHDRLHALALRRAVDLFLPLPLVEATA